MGKFRQFLTEISACDTSIFSFLDDNLSKFQWIFTKLGMCIDNVEIWFRIANGQSSVFDGVIYTFIISFLDDNMSKYQWIFSQLGLHIEIVAICLGLLMAKFYPFLMELSAWDTFIFSFLDDTMVNINRFLANLVCALLLWSANEQFLSVFERVVCP